MAEEEKTTEEMVKENDAKTTTAVKMMAACVNYKKPRLIQIKANIDMYLNVEKPAIKGLENVPLDFVIMSGFVDTLMSKIDDAPSVTFEETNQADLRKARKYTAFWEKDSSSVKGQWDAKDRNEKKSAIFEGIGISKIYADRDPKYKSHLENVGLEDFIFEPAGGGYLEDHRFAGQENIFKTKSDLDAGVKDKVYNPMQVKKLLDSVDDADMAKNEDLYNDKYVRQMAMGLDVKSNNYTGENLFNLSELVLYSKGERYYILFDYVTSIWIRVEPLKKLFKSNLYPWVTWQMENNHKSLPCQSPADVIRPIAASIKKVFNRGMDGLNKNTYNMRLIDKSMIKNLNQLNWRKNGIIIADTRNGKTLDHAYKAVEVPDRTDLIVRLSDWMTGYLGQQVGITPSAQGATDKDAKVGIYYGDIQQIADRLGLKNKAYSDAHEQKALRWMHGLDENMDDKTAVKILGPKGVEWADITDEDKKRDKEFDIKISGGNAEEQLNEVKQQRKIEAVKNVVGNAVLAPNINPKWAIENILRDGGFEESEVRKSTDQTYGEEEILAEAAEENEKMLEEDVIPNQGATLAHVMHHARYAIDEDLEKEVYIRIQKHIEAELPIAEANKMRLADLLVTGQLEATQAENSPETPGQPINTPQNTNQKSQQTTEQLTP